jgi:hypothetical protein
VRNSMVAPYGAPFTGSTVKATVMLLPLGFAPQPLMAGVPRRQGTVHSWATVDVAVPESRKVPL